MTHMMSATMAHLICGSTGAGKTTYATALSREQRAPVFSIDDWMVTLFAPDMSDPPDWSWIGLRVARCETQILQVVEELGRAGSGVILDIGLLRADRRSAIAGRLRASGIGVTLHLLDVDANERWRRVSARNAARGETYHLTVTRPMFDFIETQWQRPDVAEMAALNGVRVEAARAV